MFLHQMNCLNDLIALAALPTTEAYRIGIIVLLPR